MHQICRKYACAQYWVDLFTSESGYSCNTQYACATLNLQGEVGDDVALFHQLIDYIQLGRTLANKDVRQLFLSHIVQVYCHALPLFFVWLI